MRVIVELFGKAFILQLAQAEVTREGDDDRREEFRHVPVDPHSVGGCLTENATGQPSMEVQELAGSGMYSVPGRPFGFGHGSQG